MIPGTQGYAEDAAELIARYESTPFEEKHRSVMHLLPAAPVSVIDIGAGTGADAAWFAGRGHRVLAVEPTDVFFEAARRLHPSGEIEWLRDGLPDLELVVRRSEAYGLVMMTAVWMHLDEDQRRRAMPIVASLVAPGGRMIMSMRHGLVPVGRRMFEVTAEETIALAGGYGLRAVLNRSTDSISAANRADGVTWTRLAFVK